MKKHIIDFLVAVLIIEAFLLLFAFAVDTLVPEKPDIDSWEPYIVKENDTLWDIATELNVNEKYDVRVIIDIIQKHNNCESDIFTNDVIELPVF